MDNRQSSVEETINVPAGWNGPSHYRKYTREIITIVEGSVAIAEMKHNRKHHMDSLRILDKGDKVCVNPGVACRIYCLSENAKITRRLELTDSAVVGDKDEYPSPELDLLTNMSEEDIRFLGRHWD